MTTALNSDICRVTVVGPDKRIDLAVPVATMVAALIPALVRRVGGDEEESVGGERIWRLQRLGEPAFDPSGTPESLDWLDGEEFHLTLNENAIPELAYDDLADGIASMINRRDDRWQPEYRRPLFLALSGLALTALAAFLAHRGTRVLSVSAALTLVGVFGLTAVLFARRKDAITAMVFSLAAVVLSGVAFLRLTSPAPDRFDPGATSLLAASDAIVVSALALYVCHLLWARRLPYPPLLVLFLTGVVFGFELSIAGYFEMSHATAAGITMSLIFCLVVSAAKMTLRLAGLRGVQLPKTGSELQYDITPAKADDIQRRTDRADNYLNVLCVTVGLTAPILQHAVLGEDGFLGPLMVLVVSSSLLLRARAFLGLWQRVSLVVAGGSGYLLVVFRLSESVLGDGRLLILTGLLALTVVLIMAALRPWPQRLLPVWEFTATMLDLVLGLSILPLLLWLAGVYGWARGLFG
ncbi:type VII secretion integral membrane protein EccD [Actinoplanes sp. NPDC089786]|uniref:type VII secretion integral membrane protein EccD n=1 Tax=Actinoplanes sp. NPDC089786 TaxID=3155185 RepID=UPI003422FCA6